MARRNLLACVLIASVSCLQQVGRRAAIGGIGGAVATALAPPARADEEIDMDKIRALAAKGRENLAVGAPRERDPRDKSLREVVLGSNGAVIRLDEAELKEMERTGYLVKDAYRGRPPDYYSLRDFQPRGWFSEPVERAYGGASVVLMPAAERGPFLEARSAATRDSVRAKVALVVSNTPPENWRPPVPDTGELCGYGRYQTKCADPSPGQKWLAESANLKIVSPPEKIKGKDIIGDGFKKLSKKE